MNPSEMDSDLQTCQKIALGTAAVAGGAAAGLATGGAFYAWQIGAAAVVDAEAGALAIGLSVGSTTGYVIGSPLGEDVANFGSMGGSLGVGFGTTVMYGSGPLRGGTTPVPPGRISGNPNNQRLDSGTLRNDGRWVKRYYRITPERAQAYRDACAERLTQLEKETRWMTDEAARQRYHLEQMSQFRNEWLQNNINNR